MRWGIDLGGTKVEGLVFDEERSVGAPLEAGVLCRTRLPSNADAGYEAVLKQIKLLIDQMIDETGIAPKRIGFGTPGIIDKTSKKLKNSNSQCLNGKMLQEDLNVMLGVPCTVANDANCFALAEARAGAGQGFQNCFGVIMGTGVGGGLIINSALVEGAQGIAGEWGHVVVTDSGDACYCGQSGCVETIISGPALESWYEQHSGTQASLSAIVEKTSDDPHAAALVDRLCLYFAKGLSMVVNICDPDVIILGGGVSHVPQLYTQGLEELHRWVFNTTPKVRVVENVLGDSAGVFGAALLD